MGKLGDDSILHVSARTTRLVHHHAQLLGDSPRVLHVLELDNMAVVLKNRQLATGEW